MTYGTLFTSLCLRKWSHRKRGQTLSEWLTCCTEPRQAARCVSRAAWPSAFHQTPQESKSGDSPATPVGRLKTKGFRYSTAHSSKTHLKGSDDEEVHPVLPVLLRLSCLNDLLNTPSHKTITMIKITSTVRLILCTCVSCVSQPLCNLSWKTDLSWPAYRQSAIAAAAPKTPTASPSGPSMLWPWWSWNFTC